MLTLFPFIVDILHLFYLLFWLLYSFNKRAFFIFLFNLIGNLVVLPWATVVTGDNLWGMAISFCLYQLRLPWGLLAVVVLANAVWRHLVLNRFIVFGFRLSGYVWALF